MNKQSEVQVNVHFNVNLFRVYDHHEAKMKNHINLYDHYDSLSTTGQQLKSQEDIIWRLQDECESVADSYNRLGKVGIEEKGGGGTRV